ncbi:MAG: phosphoglucosamine mutase, partial [Oscillospiraceae bacterium]|nr:phosphoglucosamine mutase [Oscillospiraceae bacterium]
RVIDGDLILYMIARYMSERGTLNGTKVVTSVMSNLGLYKALDAIGVGYEKTDVGDKYIYECMRREGHYIGGEQSGHIIFSKYANTGDGLLTAIKVMQVMIDSKKTVSELVRDVTIYPQVLKNALVHDKAAVLSDPDVLAAADAVSARLGGDGRILLRASGTEPKIRVMVEAETDDICQREADTVIDVIKSKGYLREGTVKA